MFASNAIKFCYVLFCSCMVSHQIACNLFAEDGSGRFQLSSRSIAKDEQGSFQEQVQRQDWNPAETAVIVCDMWDLHHCLNAVKRGNEMAPRMNQVIAHARKAGATIIHAPSSCMETYQDHPARINAMNIPRSENLPPGIGSWCYQIDPETQGVYPLDQSDGGEDDDLQEHQQWAEKLASMGRNPRAPWKSQSDLLTIDDKDFISDNGEEIWSILENRKIENVILVGVHTNMCVLGRPFGLRQMSKNGKHVVLMRDMTDTMYNPLRWPYVSHFQGTDLIVEHIEKYVCPTITSDQLIGGSPFRFPNDLRPQAVIAISESLYETDKTLVEFAKNVLRKRLGFETRVLVGEDDEIPGLAAALPTADLLVLSVRRRALPAADLQAIKTYLTAGKPLVAIRTSSHAFDTNGKHADGHAEWPEFDAEILGADYGGHFPDGPIVKVTAVEQQADHPLLMGVGTFESPGSLYKSKILADSAQPILMGRIENEQPQPVAWTNELGSNHRGGRIFYTSLGHKSDFAQASFMQLLENGVRWATKMKIGPRPEVK